MDQQKLKLMWLLINITAPPTSNTKCVVTWTVDRVDPALVSASSQAKPACTFLSPSAPSSTTWISHQQLLNPLLARDA